MCWPLVGRCWRSFSPLFVGAVSATWLPTVVAGNITMLSAPYSSGRSLQLGQAPEIYVCCDSFSPLFVGAVSATIGAQADGAEPWNFQPPIRRGGLCNRWPMDTRLTASMLSAPYSSGRSLQLGGGVACAWPRSSFSPLFVGAVSATLQPGEHCGSWQTFQPPIRRGGLCNAAVGAPFVDSSDLSAPYSSGRSLQPSGLKLTMWHKNSFSPLFVGAVSATGAGS